VAVFVAVCVKVGVDVADGFKDAVIVGVGVSVKVTVRVAVGVGVGV
jgi:hypothetical protein